MILRKPYAFLIKYFKLIHIILFLMCGFLLFKLRAIYMFFREYVRTETYTYISSIAEKYIGPSMFIVVIIILISSLLILFLMKEKEKPVLFYRILIVYSFILLISLIVYNNFYLSLSYEIYERSLITIYRDVIGFLYYAIYFFIAITFVRGFGFDIKKFSFDRDLKMLNVSDSDSEEFELSVNIDKEKIVNTMRRNRRFATYFFKENALILIIILLCFVGGISFFAYKRLYVDNISYSEGDIVLANGLEYQVTRTYLTNKDKKGKLLDSYYLIVKFDIYNSSDDNKIIDLNKTNVKTNGDTYTPIINRYDLFNDLGSGYNNQILKTKNKYSDYLLVFKIKNDNYDKVILNVYDNETYEKQELKINYQRIVLNLHETKENIIGKYYLNEMINLDNEFIKTELKIHDYSIDDNFVYEYEENGEYYKKIIKSKNNFPIMKINYTLADSSLLKLSDYWQLICIENGREIVIDINLLYNDSKEAYFEFLEYKKNLEVKNLRLNIRGNIYLINLK